MLSRTVVIRIPAVGKCFGVENEFGPAVGDSKRAAFREASGIAERAEDEVFGIFSRRIGLFRTVWW